MILSSILRRRPQKCDTFVNFEGEVPQVLYKSMSRSCDTFHGSSPDLPGGKARESREREGKGREGREGKRATDRERRRKGNRDSGKSKDQDIQMSTHTLRLSMSLYSDAVCSA